MSLLATQSASRQYANRPKDERFHSLDALIDNAVHEKNLSADRTYNLKDLRMRATNENDLVLVSPRGEAFMSHWSFGQLARTIGAPAGYLRDGLTARLAADCINEGIAGSPVGSSANLLVRAPNGTPFPIVRACTSESYGRVWDAELYSAIAHQVASHGEWTLPPTWSGEAAGAYRGDRDSFLVLTEGGSIVTDPSLTHGNEEGKMFRGLLVKNSEVGSSSIVIESILYRYICGNHMLWGAVIDKSFRRRHVGGKVLRDTIREIGQIAYRWTNRSAAQDEAIIRNLIRLELASSREAVIDELRAMGASAERASSAYDTCEKTEGASPRSFWGIAQGFTRDAQDADYQSDRYELDRLAGVILARGAKRVAA